MQNQACQVCVGCRSGVCRVGGRSGVGSGGVLGGFWAGSGWLGGGLQWLPMTGAVGLGDAYLGTGSQGGTSGGDRSTPRTF